MRPFGQIFAVWCIHSAGGQDLFGSLFPQQCHDGFAHFEFHADRGADRHVFSAYAVDAGRGGGDFAFEGEIVNYTSVTASVSSDDYALLNRLTITVKVRFTNAIDEKASWNRTFTAYEDYDSTRLLTEVEGELIPQIIDKIVTDIFQASASNW